MTKYILWGSDDGDEWTILEHLESLEGVDLNQPYSKLMVTGAVVAEMVYSDDSKWEACFTGNWER